MDLSDSPPGFEGLFGTISTDTSVHGLQKSHYDGYHRNYFYFINSLGIIYCSGLLKPEITSKKC